MTYSVIGILAVVIHSMINTDVFMQRGGKPIPSEKNYRRFLVGMIVYHATDGLWGVLHESGLTELLYLDTVLYFAAMGFSVLLWSDYVVHYLDRGNRFEKLLHYIGWVFFGFQIIALLVNTFVPILFSIGADGEYRAGFVRHLALGLQMVMFLMTSGYTLTVSTKTAGSVKRRHLTIGLFGLIMILAIIAQLVYPLLPLYSIGYLLGGCMLHTYVIEDEKAEYVRALEEAQGREAMQKKELGATRLLAYTDALTGVKSKRAFGETEARMEQCIKEGTVSPFATVFFDLNGLKHVNDTLGHAAGDAYIISACRLICTVFKHSPVFRIGGDEFTAVLEGRDYEKREVLTEEFSRRIEENLQTGQVIVSFGLAEYDPDTDSSFSAVYRRSEAEMYKHKQMLRERGIRTRE